MAKIRSTRRDVITAFASMAGTGGAFGLMQAFGFAAEAGPYSGPPPVSPSLGRGKRVVILGAGMAGLVAGYELKRSGFDVRILEARQRPGGRVWTVRGGDTITHTHQPAQACSFGRGHYFNAGAARIPSSHRAVHGYCRDFSIPLEVQVNENRDARFVSRNVRNGAPLENRQVANDVRGGISELLAKAVGRGALDQDLTAEDREMLLDFLAAYGDLSRDGTYSGSTRDGYTVDPTVWGAPTQSREPIPLSELIRGDGWALNLTFTENLYQQATMMEPVGGMDAIPYAFAARLRSEIDYGMTVTRIARNGDGVRILYDMPDGTAGVHEADFCICALPFSVLSRIPGDIRSDLVASIASMQYGASCKVAWESERFWEREEHIYGGLSYVDTRSLMAWYPSYDFNSPRGVIIGTYNFRGDAEPFSEQPLLAQYEESRVSVERIHPGRGHLLQKPLAVNWANIPHTMGAWAAEGPDIHHDETALSDVIRGDGPIQFAGQHLSPIGAWMEAAIRSSHVALGHVYEQARAI